MHDRGNLASPRPDPNTRAEMTHLEYANIHQGRDRLMIASFAFDNEWRRRCRIGKITLKAK